MVGHTSCLAPYWEPATPTPCRGGLVTVSKYLREERLASEVKQGRAMIQISGIGAGGEAPGH